MKNEERLRNSEEQIPYEKNLEEKKSTLRVGGKRIKWRKTIYTPG